MVAPRSRAASSSSSTSTPAPSPITKPSRRASNGREMPVGDSACIELKQAKPKSVSVASAPPHDDRVGVAVLDHPQRRADRVRAAGAGRHDAVALARSPYFIDTAAAAALGMYMRDAQRRHHPGAALAHHVVLGLDVVWIPPIPVAITQPTRIGSYGSLAAPSRPRPAPRRRRRRASWAKRSRRRASLTDRCSLASKSRAGAGAVGDPDLAGGPALVQRGGAEPERRDRPEPGDDDLTSVRHGIHSARPLHDQVDGVADGLEVLHVLALEHDAVLVLDDLGQLDEVERVDVELLEGRRRG